jgi:hypothetical protein
MLLTAIMGQMISPHSTHRRFFGVESLCVHAMNSQIFLIATLMPTKRGKISLWLSVQMGESNFVHCYPRVSCYLKTRSNFHYNSTRQGFTGAPVVGGVATSMTPVMKCFGYETGVCAKLGSRGGLEYARFLDIIAIYLNRSIPENASLRIITSAPGQFIARHIDISTAVKFGRAPTSQ